MTEVFLLDARDICETLHSLVKGHSEIKSSTICLWVLSSPEAKKVIASFCNPLLPVLISSGFYYSPWVWETPETWSRGSHPFQHQAKNSSWLISANGALSEHFLFEAASDTHQTNSRNPVTFPWIVVGSSSVFCFFFFLFLSSFTRVDSKQESHGNVVLIVISPYL